MGIIERVSKAFETPEDWVEFECTACGETFRIERSDKRVCPECGSAEIAYLGSA